jgi:hypothetical protein
METEVDLGFEFHLNAITRGPGTTLILVPRPAACSALTTTGRTGELPSPYDGSFHGILPLEGDALLAFGCAETCSGQTMAARPGPRSRRARRRCSMRARASTSGRSSSPASPA